MASSWGITPRQSIEAECERRGRSALVSGCVALLRGDADAVDDGLVVALGGPGAAQVLAGREGGRGGYWPRVWAARGLLHVWEERAAPAIIDATIDESWRVREMALKVIARHRVGDALDAASRVQGDPVARVRAASRRALEVLTAAGA